MCNKCMDGQMGECMNVFIYRLIHLLILSFWVGGIRRHYRGRKRLFRKRLSTHSFIDPYRSGYLETNLTMKLSAVVFKRFSMRSFKTIKWLPFRKSKCLVGVAAQLFEKLGL